MWRSIERVPRSGWSRLAAAVMAGRALSLLRLGAQGSQGPADGCRGPAWRPPGDGCYKGHAPRPVTSVAARRRPWPSRRPGRRCVARRPDWPRRLGGDARQARLGCLGARGAAADARDLRAGALDHGRLDRARRRHRREWDDRPADPRGPGGHDPLPQPPHQAARRGEVSGALRAERLTPPQAWPTNNRWLGADRLFTRGSVMPASTSGRLKAGRSGKRHTHTQAFCGRAA